MKRVRKLEKVRNIEARKVFKNRYQQYCTTKDPRRIRTVFMVPNNAAALIVKTKVLSLSITIITTFVFGLSYEKGNRLNVRRQSGGLKVMSKILRQNCFDEKQCLQKLSFLKCFVHRV